jgi:anti-anti-sigma regulatory factor
VRRNWVSILLGVIDAAENTGAQLIFADANQQTIQLFEMLGLTRHVALAASEEEALRTLTEFAAPKAAGH